MSWRRVFLQSSWIAPSCHLDSERVVIRMHMISYDLFLSVSKCDIEVDYAPLSTKVSDLVR